MPDSGRAGGSPKTATRPYRSFGDDRDTVAAGNNDLGGPTVRRPTFTVKRISATRADHVGIRHLRAPATLRADEAPTLARLPAEHGSTPPACARDHNDRPKTELLGNTREH
ncbi:hypothetical protein GCM10010166_61330 [Couchioplanes caeruleus subsp. azureus]|nr:hypothetical protein GCM10010166_61330 [Couchioplanes caeruleus subsp. azureus]